MAKSYIEQLGEWVKHRESTQRDRNLVAFLAVRDDVKAALDAGYAVKTVWANMHESGRVKFGYDTFLNYANRHIRQPRADNAVALTEPSGASLSTRANKPEAKSSDKKPATKTTTPAAVAGFHFNPTPDKKDLV
jgi:hypothetical protein